MSSGRGTSRTRPDWGWGQEGRGDFNERRAGGSRKGIPRARHLTVRCYDACVDLPQTLVALAASAPPLTDAWLILWLASEVVHRCALSHGWRLRVQPSCL